MSHTVHRRINLSYLHVAHCVRTALPLSLSDPRISASFFTHTSSLQSAPLSFQNTRDDRRFRPVVDGYWIFDIIAS